MCMICALRNPTDPLAPLDQHLSSGGTPSAANPNDPIWSGFGVVQETTDADETTGTTYSLLVGQSATGEISSATDEDWFAVELVAGQTYDIRLLGFGAGFLSDPVLRIYDSAGTMLNMDDDGFTSNSGTHEIDSRLVFTATTSGTFFIEADAYGTVTGDYLLSITDHDPAGMVFTVDEIAWQLINNGNAFFSSAEAAAFNVGVDNQLTVNITGLTAEGQALAREALAVWSAYLGIDFEEVAGAAEMTFDDTDTGAYANWVTSGSTITSSTVNIGPDWLASFGTTLDSYSFETYLHEIGHALGLAHGGNYNGSATYGIDNFYLNDSLAWSIMSYMQADDDEFDFGGANDWNTYVNARMRFMYSPMVADLIATQHLYGQRSAFVGNTVYGFDGNTGIAALDQAVNSDGLMAMTVLDSDGTDLLNFDMTIENQVISLVAESMSSVLGGRHNLGIARGTVIENANGGDGQDSIVGNAVANTLRGNGANDTLMGGGGNDVLLGGAGADVLNGGDGTRDRVQYSEASAAVRVDLQSPASNAGEAAGDTFSGIEDVYGSNFNDTLAGNSGANSLTGADGDDTIYGRAGADTLTGATGNDVLLGGDGADVLNGGIGTRDRAQYSDATAGLRADLVTTGSNTGFAAGDSYVSIEDLFGSAFNDILAGNSAANILTGHDGNDVLMGRDGADTLNGGNGNDVLQGGAGADALIGGSGSRDRAQYSDSAAAVRADLQNSLLNTGTAVGDTYSGIEDLYGSNFNDSLAGDTGANMLFGIAGNDVLVGRLGDDTLRGGTGNDVLQGGSGADVFVFDSMLGGTNIDRIIDFVAADDTIQLDDAIFSTLARGALNGAAFVLGTAASSAAHRIIYSSATGELFYDSNGNGAGQQVLFATVTIGATVSASDFLVV